MIIWYSKNMKLKIKSQITNKTWKKLVIISKISINPTNILFKTFIHTNIQFVWYLNPGTQDFRHQNFTIHSWGHKRNWNLEYLMEASEPKLVNSILNTIVVNWLRLEGLSILLRVIYDRVSLFNSEFQTSSQSTHSSHW